MGDHSVYVSQLSFQATEDDIRSFFEDAGCDVDSIRLIYHKKDGGMPPNARQPSISTHLRLPQQTLHCRAAPLPPDPRHTHTVAAQLSVTQCTQRPRTRSRVWPSSTSATRRATTPPLASTARRCTTTKELGRYSYGLCSYDLCSYGLYGYSMPIHSIYSYGYIVLACMVIAYIPMAYILVAEIVMARAVPQAPD